MFDIVVLVNQKRWTFGDSLYLNLWWNSAVHVLFIKHLLDIPVVNTHVCWKCTSDFWRFCHHVTLLVCHSSDIYYQVPECLVNGRVYQGLSCWEACMSSAVQVQGSKVRVLSCARFRALLSPFCTLFIQSDDAILWTHLSIILCGAINTWVTTLFHWWLSSVSVYLLDI